MRKFKKVVKIPFFGILARENEKITKMPVYGHVLKKDYKKKVLQAKIRIYKKRSFMGICSNI